jgi:hypothetical protein
MKKVLRKGSFVSLNGFRAWARNDGHQKLIADPAWAGLTADSYQIFPLCRQCQKSVDLRGLL